MKSKKFIFLLDPKHMGQSHQDGKNVLEQELIVDFQNIISQIICFLK